MNELETPSTYIITDKKDEQISNSESSRIISANEDNNLKTDELPYLRAIQNYRLIWLKSSDDVINNSNYIDDIKYLRQVTNTTQTFTDVDECIDVITDIINEEIFIILPKKLAPTIVPMIHDITQINSIYILSEQQEQDEKWTKEWPKIYGVVTRITEIYPTLNKSAQNYDKNSVSINFLQTTNETTDTNRDQLDQSFMYTQILKEILLTIEFDQKYMKDFLTYCREEFFVGNTIQLRNVDKIEREYYNRDPIWWYTHTNFLYSTLNRALRTMEVDLIIKMGFFLRDLHTNIVRLHTEQFDGEQHVNSFKVYRGQGLSCTDFDRLLKTQGGLLSFNNFLSTSLDRQLSFAFAQSNQEDPDQFGVLFEITINPFTSSTYFANVSHVSAHPTEEEILFSMHSIFRIVQIKQINSQNDRLWQVDLTLTDDNDPQLHQLTQYLRQDSSETETPWFKLGALLIQLGSFDKAQQVFLTLLDQSTEPSEQVNIYHMLAWIEIGNGHFQKALEYHEKTIKIKQTLFPLTHLSMATSYNNIGLVYSIMAEYSKALEYYEKAEKIREKSLPPTHLDLTTSYNNLGLVYSEMGEYSKALEYFEKAEKICEKSLPPTHPDLASSYNNLGLMYWKMGEYSKALGYYVKAEKIDEKSLPPTHPNLAGGYINIGALYSEMGQYSKALEYFGMAETIYEQSHSFTSRGVASLYSCLGRVHRSMRNYSSALEYFKKTLDIDNEILPEKHSAFGITFGNIGDVLRLLGDIEDASLYLEKALEIQEKGNCNAATLAWIYTYMGELYRVMQQYSVALGFHEKASKIRGKTLAPMHPDLAVTQHSFAKIYRAREQYDLAYEHAQRAVEIAQQKLSDKHPHLLEYKETLSEIRGKLLT